MNKYVFRTEPVETWLPVMAEIFKANVKTINLVHNIEQR